MDAIERFEAAGQGAEGEARNTTNSSSKKTDGTAMVASVIQALSGALTYPDLGNPETNRRLWDRYAAEWDAARGFAPAMAEGTAKTAKGEAEGTSASFSSSGALALLGEEWSTLPDLVEVIDSFILPHLSPTAAVCEVGVGGGRVAARVRGHCGKLTCMDLSPKMLERAKAALLGEGEGAGTGTAELEFVQLDAARPAEYPARLAGAFDFVYCFDVLVHVDLHTMFRVFQSVHRLLKPGGRAFFSTANLLAPAGWRRFARQSRFTVGGFYFVCPAIVDKLLAEAGFKGKPLQVSSVPADFKEFNDADAPARGNLYHGRDYLVVVEKEQ